ncbi:precorrin-2 oxidase / ferrochelatase [Natronomonas pharaonis DSM 2160]|uniref:precorrin-2 dehydrogenase n=1 Tax=Natronomonas pharaonis (strain ATCC 35678 / DSM 2160 / CIP 103997 / JCM 8858 / NBRC 14720 / NCIMB 2260 / Gabara) TaxID=348780 RepID=A0A1U7EYN7_NATPD|nr:bifunctional precorrin-2 dehydrogenase/sirohydrochlorin ferrochelatase [Natronomonas pharaonis]CAI50341.1 precorrin-2 oxidase / ferrochelatase [Natronomonas pharaonis DSM 2160]
MIPLYHDFTGQTVLVFGGGSVGARKARRFAREADVVVVSPAFPEADYGGASLVRAAPEPEAVDDWFDRTEPALAVAATDDAAVNEAVAEAATARGRLVNRTDRSGGRDPGSVVVPATVRDGDVTVAISTGGQSPALARELRKRIESEIEGAGELATTTASLREQLKDRDISPAARRQAVRDVVQSPQVWKDLGTGVSKHRQTVDAVVESALGDTQ